MVLGVLVGFQRRCGTWSGPEEFFVPHKARFFSFIFSVSTVTLLGTFVLDFDTLSIDAFVLNRFSCRSMGLIDLFYFKDVMTFVCQGCRAVL